MMMGKSTVPTEPTSVAPTGNEQMGAGVVGGQTTGVVKETGSVGGMTDDIYAEIMAQIAFGSTDPVAWVNNNGFEKLLSKYGLTEKEYSAYGDTLNTDMARASSVMQKYSKKLQALQTAGK